MYTQWVMADTTQFSLRMEPDLLRQIDQEAEKEYKTRTNLIKEAIVHLLKERQEQEKIKQLAVEMWLKGKISKSKLHEIIPQLRK